MTRVISRGAVVLVAAAVTLTASPASPIHAGTVQSGTLSAVQTVKVKLKTSWRVTKAKQLKVKDGGMKCKVTKLVRKKNKPAKAAVLRCTLPSGATAGTSLKLTIVVKGRKGAKVSKQVVVAGTTRAQGRVPGLARAQARSPPPPPARSRGSTPTPTATAATRRPAVPRGRLTVARSPSTPKPRTSSPASTTAVPTCTSRHWAPARSGWWTPRRTGPWAMAAPPIPASTWGSVSPRRATGCCSARSLRTSSLVPPCRGRRLRQEPQLRCGRMVRSRLRLADMVA